jgi:6-pyruvoyltetrahydropterin/6-carboxytetrahydropterin synthase
MFRLTREVRFAINLQPDDQLTGKPTNSHGGFPSLTGLGHHFALRVSLTGALDPSSQYLRNIKDIDDVVRKHGIDIVAHAVHRQLPATTLPILLMNDLHGSWPGTKLDRLELLLSPFLSVGCITSEQPMVRLSQTFEFSAAHRLHNPDLSDEQNRQTFGKCNNPLGHGHNYQVQVTLIGRPDSNGLLIHIPSFEKIVAETVIDRFDHKFLNLETEEFRETIPSVENITRIIFGLLKPRFATDHTKLAGVTVWETPKTWCEYTE